MAQSRSRWGRPRIAANGRDPHHPCLELSRPPTQRASLPADQMRRLASPTSTSSSSRGRLHQGQVIFNLAAAECAGAPRWRKPRSAEFVLGMAPSQADYYCAARVGVQCDTCMQFVLRMFSSFSIALSKNTQFCLKKGGFVKDFILMNSTVHIIDFVQFALVVHTEDAWRAFIDVQFA